jgi:hypothetical protein
MGRCFHPLEVEPVLRAEGRVRESQSFLHLTGTRPSKMRVPGGTGVVGAVIVTGLLLPLRAHGIETTVERSDPSSISIRLAFPEPELRDLSVQGERLVDVSLTDVPSTIEAGWPKLPCYVATLGIPADRTVGGIHLEVLRSERIETAPVRHADAPTDEATAEGYRTPAWRERPEGKLYPDAVARVSEVSWWRNRHVAHVEMFPIRTVPWRARRRGRSRGAPRRELGAPARAVHETPDRAVRR